MSPNGSEMARQWTNSWYELPGRWARRARIGEMVGFMAGIIAGSEIIK